MGYRIYLVRVEVQMAVGAAALDKNHHTRKAANQVHPARRVKRFITPAALVPHRVIVPGVSGAPIRVSHSRGLASPVIRVKVSDFSMNFLIQV
jgi:tetrahydromethanopterin S-methyltransferase subunit E